MEYLYKLWYQNIEQARSRYDYYLKDGASVMLPFEIRPIHHDASYPLFYRASNELLLAVERIYRQDVSLQDLGGKLPDLAKRDFLSTLIVEEIFNSNEIEHVRSTRQEIARSVRDVLADKPNSKHRFNSMAHSYFGLTNGEMKRPQTLQDLRTIYDYITAGEIAEDDLPDGQWFHKGANVVETSTGKVIHRGLMPEARINATLQALLDFMARQDLPALVQVAVEHYVFGYVHPFYDGNGRTGRFLSSLYISEICSEFTAYALSQGCHLMQKQYYEIFERLNKFNSFGEMNVFIDGFLEIIIQGQQKILENIQERWALLNKAQQRISDDARLADDALKRALLFTLEQKRLFDDYSEGLTRKELSEIHAQTSYHHLCRVLDALEADGCIRRVRKRPASYVSAMIDGER